MNATAMLAAMAMAAAGAAGDANVPDRLAPPTAMMKADANLIWHDEFDGNALDMGKWGYRGLGPRRDAVNVKEAVRLDGKGHLVITTTKAGGTYHTGMIGTQGKFERAFGYWQCRVKLQDSVGHWSAFWLQTPTMGKEIGNPRLSGTEIDIYEYLARETDRVHHNLHWDGYGKHHKHHGRTVTVEGFDEGWHTVGLEWTKDRYVFYVDGKETWRTSRAVSHRPQYIILSAEVGKWAGDIAEAKLPDSLTVDYVRVYRRRPRRPETGRAREEAPPSAQGSTSK